LHQTGGDNGNFVETSDQNNLNSFQTNTVIGGDFESVRLDFLQRGYSPQEARERATAFVLNNSGITLLKTQDPPAPSGTFKKIGTQEKAPQNGVPVFDKADCN